MDQRDQQTPAPSRRDFIKTSAAVVGGTMASSLVIPGAYAAGTDEIKVGLIGCGGRGTGAVDNVLQAAPGRAPRGRWATCSRIACRRACRT